MLTIRYVCTYIQWILETSVRETLWKAKLDLILTKDYNIIIIYFFILAQNFALLVFLNFVIYLFSWKRCFLWCKVLKNYISFFFWYVASRPYILYYFLKINPILNVSLTCSSFNLFSSEDHSSFFLLSFASEQTKFWMRSCQPKHGQKGELISCLPVDCQRDSSLTPASTNCVLEGKHNQLTFTNL